MRRTAPQLLAVVVVVLVLLPFTAAAQMTMRPTPVPIVTAENSWWYLSTEPITFAGSIYYPAGPEIYFNPYEMVRSGEFRGVPLYSKTTIEPFSKVFVPLPGGRMLPYERRRAGDLAGTTGSTAPSFPVVNPSEEMMDPTTYGIAQAAVSPTMYTQMIGSDVPVSAGVVPAAVATSGVAYEPPRGPLMTARLPQGLNSVFVTYGDKQWFSSGQAVLLDTTRFRRVGDLHGFAVYAREGDENTIYVSVTTQTETLVAPYSARR
jgi:hypothetical protein